MEHPWGPSFLARSNQVDGKRHKRTISERSFPLFKRPKLFSSVRGFMHRKARSVGSVRTSTSASDFASLPMSPRSTRTQSLDSPKKPYHFRQRQRRGQTPGMDDYLTMAELENVWDTQDCFLGCYDAPQRVTGYTYIDPVEAPTITKHQFHQEPVRPPSPLRPRKSLPPQSFLRSTYHDRNYSDTSIRPPSPLRPRKRAPTDQARAKSESRRPTKEGRSTSHQRVRTKTRVAHDNMPPSQHPAWDRAASAVNLPPLPSRALTSSPSIYSQPSPRIPPSPASDVRNAVVSGVVHPALRSAPYFDFSRATANCRTASSYAVNAPSRSLAYGQV